MNYEKGYAICKRKDSSFLFLVPSTGISSKWMASAKAPPGGQARLSEQPKQNPAQISFKIQRRFVAPLRDDATEDYLGPGGRSVEMGRDERDGISDFWGRTREAHIGWRFLALEF
jgi:hypothetical protein